MPDDDFGDLPGSDFLFDDDGPLPDIFRVPEIDGTNDVESGGTGLGTSPGGVPAGEFGSISYDRGDNPIVGKPTELGGNHVPGPRFANKAEREHADGERARQATDTGHRNIGRVTGLNPHNPGTGGSGASATIADASNVIRLAIEREREPADPDPPNPDDGQNGGLDYRVANWLRAVASGKDPRLAGEQRGKLTRSSRTTVAAPDFQSTEFSCEFYGLKMNNAGYWMLTVKVENSEGAAIQSLSRSVGLNLRTTMTSEGFA